MTPEELVASCLRQTAAGTAISSKGRLRMQETIERYVAERGLAGREAIVVGNRVRGFLVHNGVFIQGRARRIAMTAHRACGGPTERLEDRISASGGGSTNETCRPGSDGMRAGWLNAGWMRGPRAELVAELEGVRGRNGRRRRSARLASSRFWTPVSIEPA